MIKNFSQVFSSWNTDVCSAVQQRNVFILPLSGRPMMVFNVTPPDLLTYKQKMFVPEQRLCLLVDTSKTSLVSVVILNIQRQISMKLTGKFGFGSRVFGLDLEKGNAQCLP